MSYPKRSHRTCSSFNGLPSTLHHSVASSPGLAITFSDTDLIVVPSSHVREKGREREKKLATVTKRNRKLKSNQINSVFSRNEGNCTQKMIIETESKEKSAYIRRWQWYSLWPIPVNWPLCTCICRHHFSLIWLYLKQHHRRRYVRCPHFRYCWSVHRLSSKCR